MNIVLGKRCRTSEQQFQYVYKHTEEFISYGETKTYEQLIKDRIKKFNKPFCLAYSAGKDSIALKYLLDDLKLNYRSLCYYSPSFEFCSLETFLKDNLPKNCTKVVDYQTNIKFISNHYKELVFPEKASSLTYFYKAQREMYEIALKPYNIDTLITGKRRKDDNNCDMIKRRKYYDEFSPMYDMPHEVIFGILHYNHLKLPKCYDFVEDAFTLGTCYYFEPLAHNRTEQEMWDWLGSVEPETLEKAARYFKGAKKSYANLIKKKR